MFWKIILVLYSFGFFCIGWQSAGRSHDSLLNVSNVDVLKLLILYICAYFVFNALYGLARKMRTLSLKTAKSLLAFIMLANICLVLNPIILLPLYIPLIVYWKQYNKFDKNVCDNFLRTFALIYFVSISLPCTLKSFYSWITWQFHVNPIIDLLFIGIDIYLLICIYGFIKRRYYLCQKFLKITILPILVINFTGSSISSFITDFKETLNYPITIILFCLFMNITYYVILYRYAFTDLIFEKPDFIQIKPIQEAK